VEVEEEKKINADIAEDAVMDNIDDDGEDSEYYYDEEDDEAEQQETLVEAIRQNAIDLAKFKIALAKKDLRINDVGTDGNCFFRAVADQLYGHEWNHWNLR
jgi:hypothetical protein